MLSRASSLAFALSALLALSVDCPPAQAGWADMVARQVLTTVIRQETNRLMQQGLYRLQSGRPRGYSVPRNYYGSRRPDYMPPEPSYEPPQEHYAPHAYARHHTTHTHHSYSAHHSSPYTGGNSFVPPPPGEGSGLAIPAPPSGLPATGAVNGLDGETDIDGEATGNATGGADVEQSASGYHLGLGGGTGTATERAFDDGLAGNLSYDTLVHAGAFVSCPMHGGIRKRHGTVKHIILHSTETGSIADATRVIHSWSARGTRHPGAQFVVDRDGTIYSTVNPDLVTVHINEHKCLSGYTNDNSIGIEIVRSGKQKYTQPQLDSVVRLVTYLQQHYDISDGNVTTHHHVQPSDRSDPVGFSMVSFARAKDELRAYALQHQQPRMPIIAHDKDARRSDQLTQLPRPAPDFRARRR